MKDIKTFLESVNPSASEFKNVLEDMIDKPSDFFLCLDALAELADEWSDDAESEDECVMYQDINSAVCDATNEIRNIVNKLNK